MSPQNPDDNDQKKKDEEKKGGAVPLWPDSQKKAPQAFWSKVNPPQTPVPKPVAGPELPSFSGPKGKPSPFFPTLSKGKAAGIPLLRGAAGGTLINRIRGLKSKDIAFIVAGLAVLILAPIAEHMISSPDDQSGTLVQGFDQKGAMFGGGNPYEEGISGIAPGGLPGQGTEVVTPLNVRDPSSLIMSPGGEEKKAPVQVEAPPSKPTAPNDGWKDAIRAAQKGVSKATEKVHLPKPNVKLAKMGGLGTPSGNTHANLSLAAPSSSGLFSKPSNRDHLARATAAPGYSGAGRRSLAGGSGGGAGLSAGRGMGGAGGAASESTPGGISGGGTGMSGGSPWNQDPGKGPGAGSGNPETKNIGLNQKEDLAFLRRKMEMEKAIGLKWDKKKYDELERKKMLEQMAAQTAQQAFLKILDKLLEGKKGGGDGGGGSGGGGDGGGAPPGGDPGTQNPPGGPATGPDNAPGEVAKPKPGEVGDTSTARGAHRTYGASLDYFGASNNEVSKQQGILGKRLEGLQALPKDDQFAKAALPVVKSGSEALSTGRGSLKSAEDLYKNAHDKYGESIEALGRANKAHGEGISKLKEYHKNQEKRAVAWKIDDWVPGDSQKEVLDSIKDQEEELQLSQKAQEDARPLAINAKEALKDVPKNVEALGKAVEAAKPVVDAVKGQPEFYAKVKDIPKELSDAQMSLANANEAATAVGKAVEMTDVLVGSSRDATKKTETAVIKHKDEILKFDSEFERGVTDMSGKVPGYADAKRALEEATDDAQREAAKKNMESFKTQFEEVKKVLVQKNTALKAKTPDLKTPLEEAKKLLGPKKGGGQGEPGGGTPPAPVREPGAGRVYE